MCMGICGKAFTPELGTNIRFKKVEEVLDTSSILPADLLKLGIWMADYYRCSVGKALYAMLPSRLQPEIDAVVKWIADDIPEAWQKLATALSSSDGVKLSELRKAMPGYALYSKVEAAEAAGLVEVAHKLGHKDKPRVVNYLVRLQSEVSEDSLALKQREAWELIKAEQHSFPMANISNLVSYSAIKALVKKGFVRIEIKRFDPLSIKFDEVCPPKQVVLNSDQLNAIHDIESGFGSFNVHLLFGITGSGKTEVYIEIIRKYLMAGKSVVLLIPEIALTPQMMERFQGSFGKVLAIQHSQLTEKDRFEQWNRIKKGEIKIVLGARSAIFAPLPNLGLIVVDEEHEGTYKQDSNPRYQGRDIAIVRAKLLGAQVILGSATPSLESWQNSITGKYKINKLLSRPLDYELPEVKLVDLRNELDAELISPILMEAIDSRLSRQEQVILFQNRRGYSSFMQCLKCGKLVTCGSCEISMSYHRDREEMQCHYCGSTIPSPRKCPDCGSYSFAYGAPGTQKLEQTLKILFPQARILRMDSDSARKRDTYKSMYNRMKKQEVDILLGTQMISKGLDFPEVTLVGVVMADISLNVPDFRAAERTFQLLTQVAGRSGRGAKNGEVIIQTYNPEHYAIAAASKQDFPRFAAEELDYRKKLSYPPYFRLARLLFLSPSIELLKLELAPIQDLVQGMVNENLLVLGPSPAPFTRISNYFRYHLILKGSSAGVIKNAVCKLTQNLKLPSAIRVQIDIDPASLM